MNRREFFKIMGMVIIIPILNKLSGLRKDPLPTPTMDFGSADPIVSFRSYSSDLRIADYDPTTHTTSVDWTSSPGLEDEFIDI